MRLRQSWLLVGLLSPVVAATAGCGEEDKGPEPPDPFVDVPKETQPTLDDGHWGLAQRGVAIDAEDIGIIQESESPAGVSVAARAPAGGAMRRSASIAARRSSTASMESWRDWL